MELMVFTDLDGTLLDHADYSFDPARPALMALRALQIPLILASSKTAAEIAPIYDELALGPWPVIIENGAALARPGELSKGASDYQAIRQFLDELPKEVRGKFLGFGDMTPAELSRVTGLSPHATELAKQRQYSEPGIWTGSADERVLFQKALSRRGIQAREGGRFLTLSFGQTKADQMRRLIRDHAPRRTLALGDAPNDIEMLELADQGVIVRNDSGPGVHALAGEETGRIRRTAEPGPAGWNRAVQEILAELKQEAIGG